MDRLSSPACRDPPDTTRRGDTRRHAKDSGNRTDRAAIGIGRNDTALVTNMTATASDRTAPTVDTSTEFGAKAAERLAREPIVWFTTVGKSGTPQPNPVWFLWHDESVLLFSQPETPKLRNIARNPRVSLNLNSTEHGENVIVLSGTATVVEEPITPEITTAYVTKYTEGLKSIKMTAEEFFADYSVPVRIVPDRLRGF